ncbi:MAG: saccharopine dehydrogenase NADP-binding domain-containing protein [Thermoanaerobaculia bacterium]|nr:saccharopine dehydrogenase NADP-binding domain-containing protein [Thermoanaerobaculia bacterium]
MTTSDPLAKNVLVLGAGFSTPYLIQRLLDRAESLGAQITVADVDRAAAAHRVGNHPRGRAIALDVTSEASVDEFSLADLVVCLIPPKLQPLVARRCVEHRAHMVSASYRSREIRELEDDARAAGVALMTEMGLDPGIDLMSAQRIIEEIQGRGGVVESFLSYGGGLPEVEFDGNPLRYCVTWNPRNVAMAGESGAQFLRRGAVRLQPWHEVFQQSWTVDVPGLGAMDAYSNRDAIAYREIHGIEHVHTLVRGTLRYPGFCRVWQLVVRLGLPNEQLYVPNLQERTWAELLTMFLPRDVTGSDLRDRTAHYLGLERRDGRLDVLEWLGLFSDEPVAVAGRRPVDALVSLLERKLPLPEGARDLVVLHHDFVARYEDAHRSRRERTLSTFICHGSPQGTGGTTAMARTVGLPAALGAELLLRGELRRTGALSPTDPDVYRPVLAALDAEGLTFEETTEPIES